MKRLIFLFILLVFGVLFFIFNPLAKKAKSGLQVIITDSIATSVYLNDNYVEKTPFINRELNPGEYKLKIQPDDPKLIPYETTIKLRPGLLTVVTWKLAQRPELSGGVIYEMEPISSKNKSEISFVTIPDGAIVLVSGKEKTFAPTIIQDIIPGHNEYEVSLPSYESQIHTINAIAGYRMLVTVKLAKVSLANDNTINTNSAKSIDNTATDSADTTDTSNTSNNNLTDTKNNKSATKQNVTIKPTNFFIENEEVLRVRDLPNSAGKELGYAKVGNTYPYLGKTENNWYNIQFNNQSGWVNTQYAQLDQ